MKKLILNKTCAGILLPWVLKIHNLLYKLAGRFGIILNNGVHPKHQIIQYQGWFMDHISSDDVIYEVGSHKGDMSRTMASKAKHVYAIEIVEDLHRKALTLNPDPKINYILGDATKYSDFKEPIDKVVLSNVLEHIDERVQFLKDVIKSVTWKDRPELLIRVPMLSRDWITVYKKNLGIEYRLDPTHYTEYTDASLEDELKAAGLEVVEKEVKFGESYLVCRV